MAIINMATQLQPISVREFVRELQKRRRNFSRIKPSESIFDYEGFIGLNIYLRYQDLARKRTKRKI